MYYIVILYVPLQRQEIHVYEYKSVEFKTHSVPVHIYPPTRKCANGLLYATPSGIVYRYKPKFIVCILYYIYGKRLIGVDIEE